MSAVDIVFSQGQDGAQPVDIVFGEGDLPSVNAVVRATLVQPTLGFALQVGKPDVNLLFSKPQDTSQPVHLVFNDDNYVAPIIPDNSVSLAATLPQPLLRVAATLANVEVATVAAMLPQPVLRVAGLVKYVSLADRPTVADTTGLWQVADGREVGVAGTYEAAAARHELNAPHWDIGSRTDSSAAADFKNADRLPSANRIAHEQAAPLRNSLVETYQNADRAMRKMLKAAHQEAERLQTGLAQVKHQDAIRERRKSAAVHWQVAEGYSFSRASIMGRARQLEHGEWVRWQNAMRPPLGQLVIVPPQPEPCYSPNTNLVFSEFWSNNLNLLFKCDRDVVTPPLPGETVVVPVQRVYVVLNNASLRRIDGNLMLATFGMSLSLDVNSWTWQFSASLPAQELSNIEPSNAGDPVVVEAMINGTPYQMLIESISRERVFGNASIRVSGRGLAATLDAPYAPVTSFTNGGARTAQQLMGDILTINGVSLGWTVNWGLTDWSIPAGIFNHQGSYISALSTIASAAGGYLQPGNVGKVINVLPRYKAAPWKWATDIVPEFSLPADVAVREGIDWTERARYNRVFVSGQSAGVLGQVTIDGTAGDLVAPMVVDALITHADAARQRGMYVLGETGRIANINLRLPVLASTNIIVPGKYIDFVDGAITRRGVVRSTQVEVGRPEIWQTLGVETHA